MPKTHRIPTYSGFIRQISLQRSIQMRTRIFFITKRQPSFFSGPTLIFFRWPNCHSLYRFLHSGRFFSSKLLFFEWQKCNVTIPWVTWIRWNIAILYCWSGIEKTRRSEMSPVTGNINRHMKSRSILIMFRIFHYKRGYFSDSNQLARICIYIHAVKWLTFFNKSRPFSTK